MMFFGYEMVDFGSIKEGESVYGRFAFSNESALTIEIEFVSACDCMETDYTKSGIAPGEVGEIIFRFDGKGEGPEVFKTIDVLLKNTDSRGYPLVKQLYLKGKIEK